MADGLHLTLRDTDGTNPSPDSETTTTQRPPSLAGVASSSREQRPERPCDLCRRRKIRCFIESEGSACTKCKAVGCPCTFDEPPAKRQRKSAQTQSSNASTAMLLSNSASFESDLNLLPSTFAHQPTPDYILPASSGLPASHAETLASLSLARSNGYTSEIQTGPAAASSASNRMSERDLTNETETTLNLYDGSTVEHVGPSGDTGATFFAATRNGHESWTAPRAASASRTIVQDEDADVVHFKVVSKRPLSSGTSGTPERSIISIYDTRVDLAIVVRQVHHAGPALIDIYIRAVHPCFPIINPQRVRHRLNQTLGNVHQLDSSDISVLLLYVSLMLVAYHWRPYLSSATAVPEIDTTVLRSFYAQTLARELAMPRLVTVQSLLLRHAILVSSLPTSSLTEVWTGMGSLVTAAHNLGLHRDPGRWSIAAWEKQIRKKLWWAIYITEKWLAYCIGRSSLINSSDATVSALSASDFDGASVEAGAARFMALVHLTGILSDVHSALFTPQATGRLTDDFEEAKSIAHPFSARLQDWYEREQVSLSFKSNGFDGSGDAASALHTPCSLHLAYYSVKVALHRALMRCGPRANRNVRLDAVRTMREISEWARNITSEDVLSVWWSAAAMQLLAITNFFLSLLFSAPTEDEFCSLKSTVLSWRWQLRMKLQMFSALTEAALQRIDDFLKDGDKTQAMWRHHKFKTPLTGNTRANSPNADFSNNGTMLDIARAMAGFDGNHHSETPSHQDGNERHSFTIPTSASDMQDGTSETLLSWFPGSGPSMAAHAESGDTEDFFGLNSDLSLEDFMAWGMPGGSNSSVILHSNVANDDWVL